MTLAAPRSRQGKLTLVLAMFAVIAAAVAVFLYQGSSPALAAHNDDYADREIIPPALPFSVAHDNVGATIEANENQCQGSGTTVWYDWTPGVSGTVQITTMGGTTNFDTVLAVFTGDPDTSQPDWEGGAGTWQELACNDQFGGTDQSLVTVDVVAGTTYHIRVGGFLGDTGNFTLAGSLLVETDPISDVNFPGTPHTVTFTLAPFVACVSGVDVDWPLFDDPGPSFFASRDCGASDLTLTCTGVGTTVTSITSDTAPSAQPSVVTVSLVNDGTEESCTISLDMHAVAGDFDPDNNVPFTASATKSFSLSVADGGVLRHHDLPDLASEDAAGTTDSDPIDTDFCPGTVDPAAPCGLLAGQDDLDDATGSFHGACIEGSGLTFADNDFQIDWQITPVAGGPVAAAETTYAGPNGEPCVRWSAATEGTQQITATIDAGGVLGTITFYYDPDVPLPLIKEWNSIDETKIVAVTGQVGEDDLFGNSGELADWAQRDCSDIPLDPGFCERVNWDGLIWQQEAAFLINTPFGVNVSAGPVSFIDYTYGSHDDAGGIYVGPVDGAEQTYTISGDCGSVRLENPTTGETILLNSGTASATILSSDKGVGFTFYATNNGTSQPTLDTADCGPLAQICIDIETQEDNLFRSPPIDDAEDERICVEFTVGPPTNKTPILAWAGQRVVLEHYWGNTGDCGTSASTGVAGQEESPCCFDFDGPEDSEFQEFGVLYVKQNGPGSFTSALQGNTTDVDLTSDAAKVNVLTTEEDLNGDDVSDPNSNCTSRIIYESEDEGQVDISAFAVDADDDLDDADPRSQQVAFVIYYMKFESATIELIEAETTHNPGTVNSSAESPPTGTDSTTANVSENVLTRLAVKGWVETTNCPARDSGIGQNGEFLPANRCIFPDDWLFKAGGDIALETRPEFDIHGGGGTVTPGSSSCSDNLAGPFSLLDILPDGTRGGCDDGLAPHYPADGPGTSCAPEAGNQLTYGCRDSNQPNGVINSDDAPMPPALATFRLDGSGFMFGADKGNLFTATHIPAEPWIAPINQDLSGYQWNTWGGSGAKSGLYDFWTDHVATGIEVVSCPALSPCPGEGVPTGGFNNLSVYTDEHGTAYVWTNGDANLTFDECDSSAGTAGNNIVLLNGFYCEDGELVGSSSIDAIVDYPDKRKHFAILSNEVTIDWTWGGIKFVTIEPGESAQFNYVVLHLTDRDGFCSNSPSLHPVLGEAVHFQIDSPDGTIVPDVNGNAAALLGSFTAKTADVTAFQADDTANGIFDKFNDPIADGGISVTPLLVAGECQAWIHVSSSLLSPVDVIVTAFDPEGTVTFDVIINEPTPVPTEPPAETPVPTPANQPELWADIDCSDNVDPVDALKVLRHDAGLSISQGANCPDAGEDVDVLWGAGETSNEAWGDADCNNVVDPVDTLKILRYDAGLFYTNQQPCPDISEEVLVTAQ